MWIPRPLIFTATFLVPPAAIVIFACLEQLFPVRAWKPPRRVRWTRHLVLLFVMYAVLTAYTVALLRFWPGTLTGGGRGLVREVGAIVGAVLLADATVYFWHRLLHSRPLLWRLHVMHHTDTELDVSTGVRTHPLNILDIFVLSSVVMAALGASFLAWQIYTTLFAACAYFQHANLRIPKPLDRAVRLAIVTPSMHRVHHSRRAEERASNYGFVFTFWDHCFGTYREVADPETIAVGMDSYPDELTVAQMLLLPLARPGAR
jgi:sterol desaturase/sphingolipid hydroxylase (fatty acid hydroxylase superfamily)